MVDKSVQALVVINQNFLLIRTERTPDKLIILVSLSSNQCWLQRKFCLSTGVDKLVPT
jgi:hypothetical protein